MEILDLASNGFTEFNKNKLPLLLTINLNFNNLSSIVDNDINPNIQKIDIESNNISDFNSFSKFNQLRRLNFEKNNVN